MAASTSAGTVSLTVKPDAGGFGNTLKSELAGSLGGVGESLGSTILSGLKMFAGPIIAVTAGLGIKNLMEDSIKSFEDVAGSVRSMQRVTGGTIEEVSGLRGAMQLAGVDADTTSASFRIFSKNLEGAMGDSKATAELTSKLGTSFLDAAGQMRPMSQLLPEVADKFASMPNGIEKTALASELFGRQGTALIPILNKGAGGIEELTAKARDMGLVLDDTSMNAFAESKKASREFDATIQGLQVSIGSALLPVMDGLQNILRDAVIPMIKNASAWVKDHREQFLAVGAVIGSVVRPVVEGLVGFFTQTLIPAIGDVIKWFRETKNAIEYVGVVIGIVIGAYVAYQTVTGILSLITAAQTALTIATYGSEAATYATGIAHTLATTIIAIQSSAVWAGVTAWWANNAALMANESLTLSTKLAILASSVATGIATAAQWAWNAALSANPIGLVIILIAALIAIVVLVAMNWEQVWGTIVDVWNGFVNWLMPGLTAFGDFFASVWNGIGQVAEGVFGAIVNFVKGYINTIIDVVNGAIDGINGLGGMIRDITGGAIDINLGHIPHLAEGGVVNRPTIALIGEAGPEAVVPLSKMNQVMPKSVGDGTQRQDAPIYTDTGALLGWMRTVANGEARLVWNTADHGNAVIA